MFESLFFKIAYDLIVVGLGSYGAYILFNEYVEIQGSMTLSDLVAALRRRWMAVLALLVALTLFLLRLYLVLFGV